MEFLIKNISHKFIDSLSDGAFSIALTLLGLDVLSLAHGISKSEDFNAAMLEHWPTFFAYALGFFLLFSWWYQYHVTSQYVVGTNATIVWNHGITMAWVALMPFAAALLAKLARSIWDGTLRGPEFFRLITHPKLLDVAEQMCGEELIASSVYRLRPKIPRHDHGAVPWHQDSGYFEPYCDDAMVLAVWLPLVYAIEENGCLWAQPGVHNQGVFRHRSRPGKGYLVIADEDMPPGEPVCCPVNKGGVLLLTNRTPHVSFDNNTDIVRWSMDLRYQSAALPTNANITRLEGESVPNEAEGVPVACYPPEADFLVRSKLRPNEIVTDPAEFHRLRTEHKHSPVTGSWK